MPGAFGANEISMQIVMEVRGEQEVANLEARLASLKESIYSYSMAKKVMTAQTNVEIQTMKNENVMLKARAAMGDRQLGQLATQSNLEDEYKYSFNQRFQTEKDARLLMGMYKEEGIKLSIGEARVAAQTGLEIVASEQAKAAAMYNTRKAMMSASISMFVLNITTQQLVTSLKPFVKGNEDAEAALKNVSAALQFSMAPLQMYMSLQMISIGLSKQQKVAFLGVASALGAVFFLYSAITAKGAGMRAMYASLAVALFAVTIAQWMLNAALATGKALVLGDFKAFAVLAAGAAIGAGVIAGLTAPKAQTLTGHRKRVRKGGMAELDDDEVVQRISKDGSKNGGGGNINIYLPEGYNGSMADAKITAHSVKRAMNSGYGSIKYQRKVVTGG